MSVKVKIDDKEISHVLAVRASIAANLDNYGERTGHSNPMHITITRDCKEVAELNAFQAGIKSPNKMEGSVEFPDSSGKIRYTLKLKVAFVSGWQLRSEGGTADGGGGRVVETLELYCGHAELTADGDTRTYKLADFRL